MSEYKITFVRVGSVHCANTQTRKPVDDKTGKTTGVKNEPENSIKHLVATNAIV